MLNGLNPNNNQIYFQKNLINGLKKTAKNVGQKVKKAMEVDPEIEKATEAFIKRGNDLLHDRAKPSRILLDA